MPDNKRKTIRNIILQAGVLFLLIWLFLEAVQPNNAIALVRRVLSPFVTGAALAFVFNVPMRAIEKTLKWIKPLKLRRAAAIILTILAILLLLFLVFLLVIPQLAKTIKVLIPSLQNFFGNLDINLREYLDKNPNIEQWVINNTEMEKLDWANILQQGISVLGNRFSAIVGGAVSAIGSVTGAIVDIVIALVFGVYTLFQKENLARQGRRILYSIFPEKISDGVIHVFRLSNTTFSNFLSGQCLEACILGCLFAVVMAIFRMPYIPLISILIAVTALIPVVGAFIGCAVGAFLIMVNDPVQAVWFIAMFLVIQQIENNLIYPRVVGTSIGLPGIWVLFSVAVGAKLMGVFGMFVMIPVVSVIYSLLREFSNKRLGKMPVASEKLTPQPPDLRSGFWERWKLNKKKTKKKNEENTQDEQQ